MTDRSRSLMNSHSHAHGSPTPNMNNSFNQTRNGSSSAALSTARRSLFQAQRARRRAQPGLQHPSSETGFHADQDLGTSVGNYSDLVVREPNGEFTIDDPPIMELDDDDVTEGVHDDERERQRLSDAVKHHQINSSTVSDQPEELLEAVRASLRAKTTALTNDNWMYEAEETSRG